METILGFVRLLLSLVVWVANILSMICAFLAQVAYVAFPPDQYAYFWGALTAFAALGLWLLLRHTLAQLRLFFSPARETVPANMLRRCCGTLLALVLSVFILTNFASSLNQLSRNAADQPVETQVFYQQ